MSAFSASRKWRTTMALILATAGLGQGQDCLDLFIDDRIRICKQP